MHLKNCLLIFTTLILNRSFKGRRLSRWALMEWLIVFMDFKLIHECLSFIVIWSTYYINQNIIIKLAKCQSNTALEVEHIDPNLYNLGTKFVWGWCRPKEGWGPAAFEFVTQWEIFLKNQCFCVHCWDSRKECLVYFFNFPSHSDLNFLKNFLAKVYYHTLEDTFVLGPLHVPGLCDQHPWFLFKSSSSPKF